MTSFLSSLISRDPRAAFPWELSATAVANVDGVQIGNSHKKADPEESASVFWGPPDCAALRTQAQKLKTMRHPAILTFLDSIEADNTLYLITERCVPLHVYMRDAQLTPEQRESVVAWGLYQILSCLKFLHEANISHDALRRAIFVTQAGDWKVAALHRSSAFSSPRSDLNQLGLVLWELFNGFNDGLTKAEAPSKMPKKLHDLYKKIATPAAAKQTAAELLRELRATGGFCKSRYVDTLLFLEEFQLKESAEKGAFFNQLREHLAAFPDDVAKYKILPRLIHTYEYGDAGPNILIPMFKLGRLLSEEEYQRRIVPCLVKLFGSPDRTTRVKLLEKIDDFAPHLTAAIVNDKIYGNLSQGFLDTSPAVRESTVKAMVVLAEKLNNHNLNTDLMKYLAKLQGSDEHGGIRTNTTICLGKIGHHLDPSGRQRILLGAFTRGLKDPFPPARMAAVLALSATQQFYQLVEIANRVIPALSPLTCDPEKQVRDQSFNAIKGFLEKLEKGSNDPSLIPELEAGVKAGGKGLLGSDKVPQWASWALKSLSGKFYKGPTPPPAGAAGATDGASSTPPPTVASTIRTTTPTPGSTRGGGEGGGGWDDDDDWKDAEEGGGAKGGAAEDDEDDWIDGWNAEPPKPKAAPPSSRTASSTGGKLQLGGKKPATKKIDDDLDSMLGISSTRFNAATTIEAPSASSGGGWDDFDSDSFASPKKPSPAAASSVSSGWDDGGDGWGGDEGAAATVVKSSTSTTAASEREARRAEMAARNEARKKELAAKRAARGGGEVTGKAADTDPFASLATAAAKEVGGKPTRGGGGAMKLAANKSDVPKDLDGWGGSGW